MERQDGWKRSWQRLSVKSCFVSSRYKFDRKAPRGGRCHGKGTFPRLFTSDRCATMRLVQHVLGSSIPMFANMAILFYVLQRVSYHKTNYLVASAAGAERRRVTAIVQFLAATRLRHKIMTEMREFTTIVTYFSRWTIDRAYQSSASIPRVLTGSTGTRQSPLHQRTSGHSNERGTYRYLFQFDSIAKVELSLSEFYLSVRNFISLFIYSSNGWEPLYRYNNVKRCKAINSRVGWVISLYPD